MTSGDRTLRMMLMAAQRSVEIIVQERNTFRLLDELSTLRGLLNNPHPHAECRAVICPPTFLVRLPEEAARFTSAAGLFPERWQVRTIQAQASTGAIIVDNREAMVVDADSLYQHTSDPAIVSLFHEHFNRLWAGDCYHVLHEDLLRIEIPNRAAKISVVSEEFWTALIRQLGRDPSQLYSLDPRRFEELVAELLSRQGCDVHLTPRTKDGGYDIIARLGTPLGRLLYLVECKRWSSAHPVGVEIVNALCGVLTRGNATGAMIVTTSRFTKGALQVQREVEHRLDLKDYNDLVGWLTS